MTSEQETPPTKKGLLTQFPYWPSLAVCAYILEVGSTQSQLRFWDMVPSGLWAAFLPTLFITVAFWKKWHVEAALFICPVAFCLLLTRDLPYPALFIGLLVPLLLTLLWWLRKTVPAVLGAITLCANLFTVIFAGTVGYTWYNKAHREEVYFNFKDAPAIQADASSPDILHILLDGYGDPDWLRAKWKCGDELANALEERGFARPKHVKANYGQTLLSMTSMFNMTHIKRRKTRSGRRQPLIEALRNSKVVTALADGGYTIEPVTSDYQPFKMNQGSDIEPWFATHYYDYSLLGPSAGIAIPEALGKPKPWLLHQLHRRRMDFSLNAAAWPFPDEPTYRFVHVLAPHPPFTVNADGSYRPDDALSLLSDGSHWFGNHKKLKNRRGHYRRGYCAKATWVGREVVRVVDTHLARDPNIVIVIQGDHGPGSKLSWSKKSRTDHKERMGAFLAVKGPASVTDRFYDQMTLVNIFPGLFTGLFGTPYKKLDDTSYYSTWKRPLKPSAIDSAILAP